eukprot:674764-Pelagomonas_calceolata.AAC.1
MAASRSCANFKGLMMLATPVSRKSSMVLSVSRHTDHMAVISICLHGPYLVKQFNHPKHYLRKWVRMGYQKRKTT